MPSRRPRRASPRALPRRAEGETGLPAGEDWLRLRGIRAYGYLGVPARERALGQRLEADVELAYPALTRRRVDALRDAIDYEAVYRFVRARLGKLRRRLLETAAEDLALGVLAAFPASRVVVRLRKLHVPVADFDVIPEVEVERVRA
ncbi:MAG TPA: dihydroneopterin aldolase [Candidatus Eisenbacteria bacterium]|nr:dihydroneopterin aldolase [Candidatus Eisenbacteria bacterium]